MANLRIGIVGLPNVGKSTLFKALSRQPVLIANYPFATIEPNTGVVPVPDGRLDKLAQAFKPGKVTPATVQFIDIAGLVAGAHKGEGLGNKFLSHIRECDAICLVLRTFSDSDITHVAGKIDPAADLATLKTELILADLATVQNRLGKLNKEAQADPKLRPQAKALEQIQQLLDEGHLISEASPELLDSIPDIRGSLLTAKPFLYVFNIDEAKLTDQAYQQELAKTVPSPPLYISAKLEAELADMPPPEAKALLADLGMTDSGLGQLIKAGYQTLGLITFFTAGEPEVKAWTVTKGSTAPEAAGKIHTDMQRGFIAAEVITTQDLLVCGSWQNAKAKGLVRSEGKDYMMQDGDVVIFRFNV